MILKLSDFEECAGFVLVGRNQRNKMGLCVFMCFGADGLFLKRLDRKFRLNGSDLGPEIRRNGDDFWVVQISTVCPLIFRSCFLNRLLFDPAKGL